MKDPVAPNSLTVSDYLKHNIDDCTVDPDGLFIWLDQRIKVGPFADRNDRNDWVKCTFCEDAEMYDNWLANLPEDQTA